jgi:hypothetical protein
MGGSGRSPLVMQVAELTKQPLSFTSASKAAQSSDCTRADALPITCIENM